jgi:hypothetical protein
LSELSFNEVDSLICLDNIFVNSEESIVDAVLAWCSKSQVNSQLKCALIAAAY